MGNFHLTEKELLILKGNALRMRFKAETEKTKIEIVEPFKQIKNVGLTLVASPIVKAAALDFIVKRFPSIKSMSYLTLGVTILLLLQSKKRQTR